MRPQRFLELMVSRLSELHKILMLVKCGSGGLNKALQPTDLPQRSGGKSVGWSVGVGRLELNSVG